MRFFIALEVPQNTRAQLKEVQENIAKLMPGAKLTDNDKLHITIAFIGDQPDQLREPLVQVIQNAVQNIPIFSLTPSYIDGFPSIHHPNTLWVGVKGDIDKLVVIRERIKDGLHSLGLQTDERRFVPHIAIAKFSNYKTSNKVEGELQTMIFGDFEPITISAIKLFESVPDNGFHKHNTLATVQLMG